MHGSRRTGRAGSTGTATVRPGRATGPLLGGSLTLLAHLCGTPLLPPLDGAILLLEDVDEKPYRLDRYFTQLRLAGALDRVAAVAIGQLVACDAAGAARGRRARARWWRALGVPAIEGIPAGHEDANFALAARRAGHARRARAGRGRAAAAAVRRLDRGGRGLRVAALPRR